MTSPPTASGQRSLRCQRCGTDFTCNLDNGCWCAEEPMKLSMPTGNGDCLCRECLRAEAERQTSRSSRSAAS